MKFVQLDNSAYERAPALAELLSQGSDTSVSENEAIGMLANLFRGVLAHSHHSDKKPSGIIGGPARHKLVAAWCKWRGDPGFLCECLEVLGFLEPREQEKLRVRGTSRYWTTIEKNSRPNAKTREKLKKERASLGARAGQGRAGDGPEAGQGRAFTYGYTSPSPSPFEASKPPPNEPKKPPPPPIGIEQEEEGEGGAVDNGEERRETRRTASKEQQFRAGKASFVNGTWQRMDIHDDLNLDFLLGWWHAARAALPELGPDKGTKRLKLLWDAVCENGDDDVGMLWAAFKYLTEAGRSAVETKSRPLAIFLGPAVYEQRKPKTQPYVAPPPPTCEAPGCTRTSVSKFGDKLLCYEEHGPAWMAEYDRSHGFASA